MEFHASTIYDLFSIMSCGTGPLTNPDEETSEMSIEQPLQIICDNPSLAQFASLLKSGMDMLGKFQVNQSAAKVTLKRIRDVILLFGNHKNGIVVCSERGNIDIPAAKIADLEVLLSESLQYLSRYCTAHAEYFILLGHEAEKVFTTLHRGLESIIYDIVVSMQLDEDELFLPPLEPYVVSSGMLDVVRNSKTNWLKELGQYASKRNITEPEKVQKEFRQLLASVGAVVEEVELAALLAVSPKATDAIRQSAFRSLWQQRAKKKQIIRTRDFCEYVRVSLQQEGLAAKEAMRACSKLSGFINHGKPLQMNDTVSIYQLAKLVRHASAEERSLATVIKQLNPNMSAPSFDNAARRVFFETGQDDVIRQVLVEVGWAGVVGPPNCGKTIRLRHVLESIAVHANVRTLQKFVWIDFDLVQSDVDGIARVAAQLFFPRSLQLGEMEEQWKNLLDSLPLNSIVVFDNVFFSPEDCANVDTTKLDKSWVGFIRHLLVLCRPYLEYISFVIAANTLEPLVASVAVEKVVRMGPLSGAVARDMISSLSVDPKIKVVASLDPAALLSVSSQLPGDLVFYSKAFSIAILRKIAHEFDALSAVVTESPFDAEQLENRVNLIKIKAAKKLFSAFPVDLKKVCCCLSSVFGYFTIPMIWDMATDLFEGDVVRFYLAWQELQSIGWISPQGELGYKLCSLASLVQCVCSGIPLQFLYDNYVLHWAQHLAKINESGAQAPSALDEFARFVPHFRHVFDNILNNARAALASAESKESEHQQHKKALEARKIKLHLLKQQHGHTHGQAETKKGQFRLRSVIKRASSLVSKTSDLAAASASPASAQGDENQDTPRADNKVNRDEKADDNMPASDMDALSTAGLTSSPPNRRPSIATSFSWDRGERMRSQLTFGSQEQDGAEQLEWSCVDIKSVEFPTSISSSISARLVERVAGKVGRILTYHFSPTVGLRVAELIKSCLSPTDEPYYDAAVVDYAEQCLRNGMIKLGVTHIQPIISVFFSPRDDKVHDAPYYAARSLIIQGRLLLAQDARVAAHRAFEAADHLFQLQNYSPSNHFEHKLAHQLKHELKATDALKEISDDRPAPSTEHGPQVKEVQSADGKQKSFFGRIFSRKH